MSMEEKYGSFEIKNIVHYDEVERDHFSKVIWDTYKGNIIKVNGKKVMGHGFFKKLSKEEWRRLGWIEMRIVQDEVNGITSIKGYGHRNAIFPLEMWVREMFDQGRVVVYSASDTCARAIDFEMSFDEVSNSPDIRDFYSEKQRRLQMLKNGEKLELPKYRQEQGEVLKK
jgi:hypothetical protein